MDGSCGSVSLDAYWNNVAIPFLFIVLGFGLFVLFSLSDIQFSSTEKIVSMVGAIASSVPPSRSRRDEDEPPPPPPPPSAGNAKPPSAKVTAPPAGNPNVENMSKGTGKSPPAKNAPVAATKGSGNSPAAKNAPVAATNANIMANLGKGSGK